MFKTCGHAAPDKVSSARACRYTGAMNTWFWLLIALPPILVFSVKPEAKAWRLAIRLLSAIAIGYALANIALHWNRHQEWQAYEACQSQFPDGGIQHHKECPEIDIGDGASIAFYLFLGWIPAGTYTGFWELIWRIWYRDSIRAMGGAFKGKWVSNSLIIFSVPVWLYIFVLLLLYVYLATCHWFNPGDKCLFAG